MKRFISPRSPFSNISPHPVSRSATFATFSLDPFRSSCTTYFLSFFLLFLLCTEYPSTFLSLSLSLSLSLFLPFFFIFFHPYIPSIFVSPFLFLLTFRISFPLTLSLYLFFFSSLCFSIVLLRLRLPFCSALILGLVKMIHALRLRGK